MPAYLRGQPRDEPVAARAVSATANTFYGFKRKDIENVQGINRTDVSALGHFTLTALPQGALTFYRATSPKPPRVTKVATRNPNSTQQGSVSTFLSVGSERTAINAGWNLVSGRKVVNLKITARYLTAIALLSDGTFYCFPMNIDDFGSFGADLGLIAPNTITTATERARLVMGCSRPRPARVGRQVGNGGKFSSFCSFNSLDSALAAGFYFISGELIV